MMTYDEFNAKFDKIAEATDPDIRRKILEQFDDCWENLAFGILEQFLFDRIKYNSVSHMHTGETEFAVNMAKAQSLAQKLEKFKEEFNER